MEVTDRADGVTVVNDAYNANPESMRAALGALAALPATAGAPGRARADGASSAPRPRPSTTARPRRRRRGVDLIVAVGRCGRHSRRSTAPAVDGEESVHVADAAAAARAAARRCCAPGDVVLVKASRAAGLEPLAADLLADGDAA